MREKGLHRLFVLSVGLKGFYALAEIASGLALYFIAHDSIIRVINRFTTDELVHDPHDWLGTNLLGFARGFSLESQHFYAFYLITHGVLKLAVVIGLLRERLWAYPSSFVLFSAFIAYQLYRYSYTHDFGLVLLSILDLLVIVLAWHEYRLLRRRLPTH
jgi:uncharacterized membrane protein